MVMNYFVNAEWCDAVLDRQPFQAFRAVFIFFSYINNLLADQLVSAVKFAATLASDVTAFANAILHVFGKRSFVKMIGPNTARIITMMTGVQMGSPWTNSQNPGSNMRPNQPLEWIASLNFPISPMAQCCRPNPTVSQMGHMLWNRTTLINLRPKPLWECFRKTLRSQVLRSNLNHSSVLTPFGLQAQRRFLLPL